MDLQLNDSGALTEEDAALATRAAWLYHAGGLTQSEVAAKLGVTNAKAHRLIGRAARAGLVRVFVDGPIGNCIAAEAALSRHYGLSVCRVVPVLDGAALPLRPLGIATATFLRDVLEAGKHDVIALGHGRTLSAAIDFLPRIPAPGLRLVTLLGGLPRRVAANPFEVIDRLAEKTSAEAYMMPVPMFAREPADRDVLRRQAGVPEALALAEQATLLLMGIGELTAEAFLVSAGVIAADELRAVRSGGAVGEMLGYFFDAGGQPVATPLHDRAIARPLAPALRETNPARQAIAVAGGKGKAAAIQAVLRSGLLTGLITDELTARQLVAAFDDARIH